MIRFVTICALLILCQASSAQQSVPGNATKPSKRISVVSGREAATFDLEPVDASRNRTVPIRVYVPAEKSPRPVILYSHGLGGSRETKSYLGQRWSKAGFVCVFMQHAGSDREVLKIGRPREKMKSLRAAASYKNSQLRIADVSFVIDQLENWVAERGHRLFERIDLNHIGMSGHSFGAATTLSVAGRKYPYGKSYLEPRIAAFLAMSPQAAKGQSVEQSFGNLKSPILCMTGTKDSSPIDRSTTAESRISVFDAMPDGNKYLLVFDGGHHFTFGGGKSRMAKRNNPNHQRAIETLSTKFWKAHLGDDQDANRWLQSMQPKLQKVLDPADRWVWK